MSSYTGDTKLISNYFWHCSPIAMYNLAIAIKIWYQINYEVKTMPGIHMHVSTVM